MSALAVLAEVIRDMGGDTPGTTGYRLAQVHDAFAELIEAARELDEELDGPAIAHRLRAALARVGGESGAECPMCGGTGGWEGVDGWVVCKPCGGAGHGH